MGIGLLRHSASPSPSPSPPSAVNPIISRFAFLQSHYIPHGVLLTILLFYILLVRQYRYHRSHHLRKVYKLRDRKACAMMTTDQAQSILYQLASLEFPRFYGLAVFFAIFKTYGVPSVARTLTSTNALSNPHAMSKRLADTSVLILEMCLSPPSSDRCREAIARINYLHAPYRSSGKIKDEDMLYTLSLFALEPIRWSRRFEWRVMSDLEVCAQGTLMKALGDAMDISYDPLPGCDEGWRDGIHWLEDIKTWSDKFELDHVVPGPNQAKLADTLIQHALPSCPTSLLWLPRQIFAILLRPRVATAMSLPTPSIPLRVTFHSFLWLRKIFLRHLCPPRSEYARKRWISTEPDEKGRCHTEEWLTEPWYVEPTFWRRWGLTAWVKWGLGATLPSEGDERWCKEGYKVRECGPDWCRRDERWEEFRDAEELRMDEIGLGKSSPFHLTDSLLDGFLEGKGVGEVGCEGGYTLEGKICG